MGDVGEKNGRHADEKPRMQLAMLAEDQRRQQDESWWRVHGGSAADV